MSGWEPTALPGGILSAEYASPGNPFKPATRLSWQGPLNAAEAVREQRAIADTGFGEVPDEAHRLHVRVSLTMGAVWPVRTPNTGEGSGHAFA